MCGLVTYVLDTLGILFVRFLDSWEAGLAAISTKSKWDTLLDLVSAFRLPFAQFDCVSMIRYFFVVILFLFTFVAYGGSTLCSLW
jgi:hypothetical protein